MVNISLIAPSDINKFSKFAVEIWHEYWPSIISEEQISYMLEKFQSENAIKEQIRNENYFYFYIVSQGANAGYTGLALKEDYLFLSKMYIKKEYRHKGFGTQAFKRIVDFAKKHDKKSIKLTVNKQNTNSINAYIKWGFKIIDAVVTDIGSGFVMDDYIMEYVL